GMFTLPPGPTKTSGVTGGEANKGVYPPGQTRLLNFIGDTHTPTGKFTPADFHGTTVNRLSYQTAPFGPQIQTNSFEVITGPVAFDKPFGPTVVDLATSLGLLTPAQNAFYNTLPDPLPKQPSIPNLIHAPLPP